MRFAWGSGGNDSLGVLFEYFGHGARDVVAKCHADFTVAEATGANALTRARTTKPWLAPFKDRQSRSTSGPWPERRASLSRRLPTPSRSSLAKGCSRNPRSPEDGGGQSSYLPWPATGRRLKPEPQQTRPQARRCPRPGLRRHPNAKLGRKPGAGAKLQRPHGQTEATFPDGFESCPRHTRAPKALGGHQGKIGPEPLDSGAFCGDIGHPEPGRVFRERSGQKHFGSRVGSESEAFRMSVAGNGS
jgi:hypothetical protein